MPADVVSVQELTHTYPPRGSAKGARSDTAAGKAGLPAGRQALRGITFTIGQGELFGLLGPNGGGKTTTFHILSTFFPPTGGKAMVFDVDIAKHPEEVRRRLGVVFQSPSLDKKLTVRENLWHQGHLYGLLGKELDQRIQQVLSRVSLSDRADELVEVLSGGLKRRVEVAKGLLHHPGLLLLDEPSTGLDPGARKDLWDYLKELKEREGVTLLVTTHLMEEAEKCDRVAILHEGRLVALGTPAALKSQIGGDMISLETPDPAGLSAQIQKQFGASVQVVDGVLRIERQRGHEFIPQLVGAFPGQITSVTLGKPTLEDVFIQKTGHRFWNGASPPTPLPQGEGGRRPGEAAS